MKPDSKALRKGRVSQAGFIYHIRFCTVHRQPLIDFHRGCKIAAKLHHYFSQHDDELLCWVLMPDHVHLLFQLGEQNSLEQTIRTIKSTTSRLFPEVTALWQKGFFDHALRNEQDLPTVARYIAANPIRAGLVKNVRQYPFWDAIWLEHKASDF